MKRVTTDFISLLLDEAILEYTKNRFISEDEIKELKSTIIVAAEERVKSEVIGTGELTLTFNIL